MHNIMLGSILLLIITVSLGAWLYYHASKIGQEIPSNKRYSTDRDEYTDEHGNPHFGITASMVSERMNAQREYSERLRQMK